MDLTTFLIQCLNSVQYGLLLFLIASGLTLIFGIMGVINLAHGSFYMIGAYMAFSLSSLTGNFVAALVLGVVLAVAFGYVLEWCFFSFLYEREHLQQVLMTYGLILVFEEMRSILVGDDVHGVPVPDWLAGGIAIGNDMTYPIYRLFISGVCVLLAVAMYAALKKTRLGMMVRAGATNREMVQSLGINISLLYRIVFAVGVAIAVLAGMIAAPVSSVYPGMGGSVLINCFVVVVIGGIGSIKGALVASLLIGFVDTFGKVFWQQAAGALLQLRVLVDQLVGHGDADGAHHRAHREDPAQLAHPVPRLVVGDHPAAVDQHAQQQRHGHQAEEAVVALALQCWHFTGLVGVGRIAADDGVEHGDDQEHHGDDEPGPGVGVVAAVGPPVAQRNAEHRHQPDPVAGLLQAQHPGRGKEGEHGAILVVGLSDNPAPNPFFVRTNLRSVEPLDRGVAG